MRFLHNDNVAVFSEPLAQFPGQVWDASSAKRSNDRTINREPLYEDWDQAVAEIIAIQTKILNDQQRTLTNDNAGTVSPGMVVYIKSNGHVDLAKADSGGTAQGFGLAQASILTTASGVIQYRGNLVLTTSQWDTVAGTSGGLTPGTLYYLSDATAGKITSTAPSTSGHIDQLIGEALSATELVLKIGLGTAHA